MADRIKLTADDIHVINHYGDYKVKFRSLEGVDILWTIEEAQQLKKQIIDEQIFYENHAKCSFEENDVCCPYEEKAEKYDFLVENDYITVTELGLKILEEENKQLKKDIIKQSQSAAIYHTERDFYKAEIDKIKKFVMRDHHE